MAMSRRARLWAGTTFLVILAINYAIIGFPLARRSATIEKRLKIALIEQAKPKGIFKDNDEGYMIELYRKERSSIEGKMLILNAASISLLVVITSWTVFGLIFHKGK